MKKNSEKKFYGALHRLESNPDIGKMQAYSQHRGNRTYRHSRNVAVSSFRLAQRLGWRIDEKALATGAMLHDYYLYTFKDEDISAWRHCMTHPGRALANAQRIMPLNEREKNIIVSHMWPLTLFTLPKSKEALLVSLADKYCALREFRGKRALPQ